MITNVKPRRMHALFSGRVQGVGFRFTVCRIARGFDVTGFVRNLWNGDVELVAEGAEPALSEFLNDIRNSSLRQHITAVDVSWEKPTGEFEQFGVTFS